MGEVKRYDPINSDGTCGMCIEDADYGAYVEYADYATLEAERDQLRAELERRAVGDWWIHVNDATPNTAQEVIVFSEFDGVTAGFLDSYDEWYYPNSNYKLTRVSHWMPLPAAPGAAPSAPKADDPVKQMLEALEDLVRVNEQHNSAIQRVTGTPAGWKDDYLNLARAAIAAARKGENK